MLLNYNSSHNTVNKNSKSSTNHKEIRSNSNNAINSKSKRKCNSGSSTSNSRSRSRSSSSRRNPVHVRLLYKHFFKALCLTFPFSNKRLYRPSSLEVSALETL